MKTNHVMSKSVYRLLHLNWRMLQVSWRCHHRGSCHVNWQRRANLHRVWSLCAVPYSLFLSFSTTTTSFGEVCDFSVFGNLLITNSSRAYHAGMHELWRWHKVHTVAYLYGLSDTHSMHNVIIFPIWSKQQMGVELPENNPSDGPELHLEQQRSSFLQSHLVLCILLTSDSVCVVWDTQPEICWQNDKQLAYQFLNKLVNGLVV